ncbi:MAG: penicillin-binding protein activator [Candidatus Zixiibacteriota bacterium]|nr:MAG: penicillin-binding protein activator [candidate division Zixibacteria bacterium]
MRTACTALALLFLAGMAAPGAAETIDDSREVVSLYSRGKRLLRQGDWLEAARAFEELAGRFPHSKNYDLFVFNRAKADYYFGNSDKALAGFNYFMSRYPDSPHRAHAQFFVGNIYYQKGSLSRSLSSYIEAYGIAEDRRLVDILAESVLGVVSSASSIDLSPADFESIAEPRRCQLIRSVAGALLARNEFYVANRLFTVCGEPLDIDDFPGMPGSGVAADIELALVLPFSGELQSFGDEIYNGAVIASEYWRQETGKSLKLVPYDTKGDPIAAARIVRELVNSSTDAVIGPLTSEEAQVASAILSCENLPMIAPAATQAGLTKLSGATFQLSPNIELQAVHMAEYAAMNLQADSAVIITSTNSDHLLMARAFAARFGELGGAVVSIGYYRPRDTDFGACIRDIKTTLLGIEDDSAYFINPDGDTLHADALPAFVDCLYLPGSASQLRLLLPQLHFYNINAVYLGSDGWDDNAVYRLGDDITKLALFPSPFLQVAYSEEYTRFSSAYDARYGKSPQRLAALGYDAARIVTQAVLRGGVTRDLLVARLAEIQQFNGAAARVSFGEHHENTEMPVYRIENGLPVPVGISQETEPSPEDTD